MKKYISFAGIILILFLIGGCEKEKPFYSWEKLSAPAWKVDSIVKNAYSMTAVVQISDSLKESHREEDQIAAFIDNECRGTGVLIKTNVSYVYFILIHGTASEVSKVYFKYYNSNSQYMFQTSTFLDFTIDGIYGSPDNPKTLIMKQVHL